MKHAVMKYVRTRGKYFFPIVVPLVAVHSNDIPLLIRLPAVMTGARGGVDAPVALQHKALQTLAPGLAPGDVTGDALLVHVVAGPRAVGGALHVLAVLLADGGQAGGQGVVKGQL